MTLATEKLSFDIEGIMAMMPHRYPFLLVDRITECIPGQYAKGYKNLTANEAFFNGHFPEHPVMPGVLQIEALAQCAAPILRTLDEYKGKDVIALFGGIDKARFKGIVRPGDRFDMHVELIKRKKNVNIFHATGYVDGSLVVDATFMLCVK